MSQTVTEAQFQELLRTKNLKFTRQRRAVFQELMQSPEHRECEEIFNALHDVGLRVSRATVYRTMDLLVESGLARKLTLGSEPIRYERLLKAQHHDHLICVKCGQIAEFVDEVIESRQEEVCRNQEFKPIRHVHQIFGLCSRCNAESGEAN